MRNPEVGTRRSAIEIVHEVLFACSNGGINKAAIMYRCGLSYVQLRRYLARLCDQGLLQAGDTGHYQITPKGRETLKQASTVIGTLTPSSQ